jgi:lauroyl/myristoyl acyltransferase
VQEKMASRNPVLRALASAASRVWFPAAIATARAFPRSAIHRGGGALARAYYTLRPKYQRAARSNLSVILGQAEDAREVRKLADAMLASHFAAWVDFLQFATRRPQEAARLIESVTGYSRIVEGRLAGKGVLLLTAHLGNWEVGGLMLAQVNQPIHVVLVPDIFPGVERQRRRFHERLGVHEIRVDHSFVPTLAVLRALSDNEIVAMQGDRDFDNTGVSLPFFGREAFFPRGPLRVAMASGATVLPAFIVRMPDGRYRAIVEEPLPIERNGDRDSDLRENLRRYAAILERYVRQYPDQWYCFYPFWDDPSRKGRRAETAATKNAS